MPATTTLRHIADICSMSVRIFAATEMEVGPLRDLLKNMDTHRIGHPVAITVTGPGLLPSSFHITQTILQHRPDFMIQVGVAGSYTADLPRESVALIQSEIIGDSGVIESGLFRDLFELGLQKENDPPFHEKKLENPHLHYAQAAGWPLVTGITVNEMTTNPERIAWLKSHYGAVTESLEGAAFHYAGLMLDIPFFQIRAISNFVGERDKSQWSIHAAIQKACHATLTLLSHLPQ